MEANSEEHDQTPQSVVSALGLHRLTVSLKNPCLNVYGLDEVLFYVAATRGGGCDINAPLIEFNVAIAYTTYSKTCFKAA